MAFSASKYNESKPVQASSVASLFRFPIVRAIPLIVPDNHDPNIKPTRTIQANFDMYVAEQEGLCVTWLGHAGFLIQLPDASSPRAKDARPVRVLCDPMFAERASPSAWFGPRRRLQPPCTVNELPTVDFVVVSHNHYDHLDLEAIEALWKSSSQEHPINFLVPLGVKETLTSIGINTEWVHELDWWDSITFPPIDLGPRSRTVFTCTPAQHNSGRGILDQQGSLWASWVIQQITPDNTDPVASVYFAGDTGYKTSTGPCPVFKEIGEKYGPFHLAMIPIWRGSSLSFLSKLGYQLSEDTPLVAFHASPEDALAIAADVRARHALGMHFATFAGSDDEAFEPLVRLAKAQGGKADWREEGGFGAIHIGESIVLPLSM